MVKHYETTAKQTCYNTAGAFDVYFLRRRACGVYSRRYYTPGWKLLPDPPGCYGTPGGRVTGHMSALKHVIYLICIYVPNVTVTMPGCCISCICVISQNCSQPKAANSRTFVHTKCLHWWNGTTFQC